MRSAEDGMQVFLSYSNQDAPLARYLKARLARDLKISVSMFPDDAPPGSEWIERIRMVVATCDEILSLLTPRSVQQPWLVAEWACFWFQGKPLTPLLAGVSVADLWEPFRRYQAVDLFVPDSSDALLARLREGSGMVPPEGYWTLADEIALQARAIDGTIRRSLLDDLLQKIQRRMRGGTGNVGREEVLLLVEGGETEKLLSIALAEGGSNVKRRQVAVALIDGKRWNEALQVTRVLAPDSGAETKNVATHVVWSMDPDSASDSDEWQFLMPLYDLLPAAQRRVVLEAMRRRGIQPFGPWARRRGGGS